MNTEQKYQVFQIKPGKPMPVFIDPNDPKGIKAIQAILAREKGEEDGNHHSQAHTRNSSDSAWLLHQQRALGEVPLLLSEKLPEGRR